MYESLFYGLAATVLVGGSFYVLARYTDSTAPLAPAQATQAAPRALLSAPVARPAAPAPPLSAELPPPPPENVVRTATKTYYLPSAPAGQADVDTYNGLRRNCYEAARNNQNGEYPALQQSACNSFSEFARRKGWDTGELPAYGTPRPRQQVVYEESAAPDNAAQCQALFQEEQSIEAEMRAGYREPRGNWLRARLRDVEEQLGKLHCPRR